MWTVSCRTAPGSRKCLPELQPASSLNLGNSAGCIPGMAEKKIRIPDDWIVDLYVPAGIPFVCAKDDSLRPIRNYYMGDPEEIL